MGRLFQSTRAIRRTLARLIATAALAGAPAIAPAAVGDVIRTVTLPGSGEFNTFCDFGIGTSIAIVTGASVGLPQEPVLLVTTCHGDGPQASKLFFFRTTAGPAQLVFTLTTTFTPPMGWGALAFRTDKGDLLACGNQEQLSDGAGNTHTIYRIPLSKTFATNEFPTTTPVQLFVGQPGYGFQACDGIAWDTVANRIYQSPDVFHTIYRFGETGSNLGTLAVPVDCNPTSSGEGAPIVGGASGVSIAGENLYIGCSQDPEILRVNKDTGVVLERFGSPHVRSSDLECDPISFGAEQRDVLWTKGAFDDNLIAVEVARGTCGGAPPVVGGPLCSKLDGTPDMADTDGDGLLDCWERPSPASAGMNGDPCIDHNGDGVCDLALCVDSGKGRVCANPYRKDVFVEVDWLQGHQPDQPAITSVINRFDVAPVANPLNPATLTSISGIRLHVQVNEALKNGPGLTATVIPHTSTLNHLIAFEPYTAAAAGQANVLDFDQLKQNNFGTIGERQNSHALAAKRQAFRYMIFAHMLVGLSGTSGAAEVHGNDGIVTLGAATVRNSHAIGTEEEQAGTFMHELGHLLGLRHGGGDFVNCKPNYLSVMNYTRQFPSRPIPLDSWRLNALDYSRTKLPALNKSILIETAGINPPSGVSGNITVFGPTTSAGVYKDTTPAIDWNRNTLTSASAISILGLNQVGSGCPSEGTGPGGVILEGYEDWNNLRLDVRSSLDIADGDRLSLDDKEPEQGFPGPLDESGNEINPCTAALCPVALSTTDTGTAEAPVVVPVDTDADGIPDLADNCPAVSNANQADANGDGIGDACQQTNVSIDIRPGRYPNTVNLNSPFQLSVAILGANGFNATSVRPETVLLSGAKVLRRGQLHLCSPLDVNKDGFTDLLCVVDKRDLVLPSDNAIAVLTAKTRADVSIRGEDSIHILRGQSHHNDD
jgi:hypothetical protein